MENKENLSEEETEIVADSNRIAEELYVLIQKVKLLKMQRRLVDIEIARLTNSDYQVNYQKVYLIKQALRQKKHKKAWKKLKSKRSLSDAHQRF